MSCSRTFRVFKLSRAFRIFSSVRVFLFSSSLRSFRSVEFPRCFAEPNCFLAFPCCSCPVFALLAVFGLLSCWGEGPPKCSGSGLRTPQNTSTSDSPSRGIKHSAAERFPFSAEKIALSPPLQVVSLPFAESLIPRAHWPEPQRAGELLHLPRAPRAPRVARARVLTAKGRIILRSELFTVIANREKMKGHRGEENKVSAGWWREPIMATAPEPAGGWNWHKLKGVESI